MQILRSIDALAGYIRKSIEESKKSNEEIVTKYEYIPEYPWSNTSRVIVNFSNRRKQISNDKHNHKVLYCEVDCL